MKPSVELEIDNLNAIDPRDLMDEESQNKPLVFAKRDKTASRDYYDFADRCQFSTFFLKHDWIVGDEVHIWVRGNTDTRTKWKIAAKSALYLILTPIS